jgi:hypothetical protein
MISTVKSLTWLTSTCLRTLNWWMPTFQWGLVRLVFALRKACFEVHLMLAINLQIVRSTPRRRLLRGPPAAE